MLKWATRFQTIMSLPQRHGIIGRAAAMGVLGGVAAVVIGAFPAVREALQPWGFYYTFFWRLSVAHVAVLPVTHTPPFILPRPLQFPWRPNSASGNLHRHRAPSAQAAAQLARLRSQPHILHGNCFPGYAEMINGFSQKVLLIRIQAGNLNRVWDSLVVPLPNSP